MMQPYLVDDLYVHAPIDGYFKNIIYYMNSLLKDDCVKVRKSYTVFGLMKEQDSCIDIYSFSRIAEYSKRIGNIAAFAKIIKNGEYFLLTSQNRKRTIKYNISKGDLIFDHNYTNITSEIFSIRGNEDFLHKINFSYLLKKIKNYES